jgi:hypothetical protein
MGYVDPVPAPSNFTSARLWGIAIADTQVPGHESAQVEPAATRLTCRIDGKDITLNDDGAQLRGGLYQRKPWFATDAHDPIPLGYDLDHRLVVLRAGTQTDRVWRFWGHASRCPPKARRLLRSRPSQDFPGALLQMGMDYWRSPTTPYGAGGITTKLAPATSTFPPRSTQFFGKSSSGKTPVE